MQTIWAERALVEGRWERDVHLYLQDGRIRRVESGTEPADTRVDLLVPAPANLHGHAFQRAMAGLAEGRGAGADSFWTWRALMYRFLERLTPEHVEAIAALVQMEMLEAGFGACVEFHYLHHRPDGGAYDRPAEMAERIAAAAASTGIGLTLLPVPYRFGGCDRRALGPGQRRFGTGPDGFARLVEGARAACADLPGDAVVGVAPHSLRAVPPEDFPGLVALAGDGPIHMHLAEQPAEVAEVRAALGARPVEWAVANLPLDGRWCLIHCTQMEPHETAALAGTGAVAGLCPLTEANLGDGVFDGVRWLTQGGAVGIGSDSHVRVSLAEELRQLETSQRLRDGCRAALATPERSTGRRLLEDAAEGGARAAARGPGRITPGAVADLLALDTAHPDLAGLPADTVLDVFVCAGDSAMVGEVWSAGRHLVRAGRHVQRERILAAYRSAAAGLRAEL